MISGFEQKVPRLETERSQNSEPRNGSDGMVGSNDQKSSAVIFFPIIGLKRDSLTSFFYREVLGCFGSCAIPSPKTISEDGDDHKRQSNQIVKIPDPYPISNSAGY